MDDCTAGWDSNILEIGNSVLSRRWRLTADGLVPISLLDKVTGKEWLIDDNPQGTLPASGRMEFAAPPAFRHREGPLTPAGAPALHGELHLPLTDGAAHIRCSLCPECPHITHQLDAPPRPAAPEKTDTDRDMPSGVETSPPEAGPQAKLHTDIMEHLHLAAYHHLIHVITLTDRTDNHDNLMQWQTFRAGPAETLRLRGCLFVIEDIISRRALILLKEAPLPEVRPVPVPVDLEVDDRRVRLLGHGAGECPSGYPWTVLTCGSGRHAITATLQAFQRRRHQPRAGLHGTALSNTWRDRNRSISAGGGSAAVDGRPLLTRRKT